MSDAGAGERGQFPEATLGQHLFDLAQQVTIALGQVDNPVTGQREHNLPAARYLIDVIAMLDDKTRGNRTPQEDQAVSQLLANLKMAFVQASS